MEILLCVIAVVWIIAAIFTIKKQSKIEENLCGFDWFATLFIWPLEYYCWFIKAKKKDNYPIKRIARSIGYFYQNKYSEQNHHYIRECIEMLKIHGLEMKGNILWITLGRPGLLIGKRGENIDALLKYLQNDSDLKNLKIENIMLKESVDLNALFSYEALYADYSYDPRCDDFDD